MMATPDAAPPAHPLLWFVDRSRWETGTSRCARKRYLEYHAGPTGYGLAPVSESLPLATGLSFHEITEQLDRYLLDFDRLPDDGFVRGTIDSAQAQYQNRCAVAGYQGILAGQQTDETIREQSTLLAGMAWAYRLTVLPWLHQQYRVLAVEEPKHHFLSCTCGAGPLPLPDHIARQCAGIVLMQRQDLLAQHRQGGHLAYFEKKTTGWDSDAWAEQWETKPQLGLGTLDAQARYGREVTEIYIIGISKGARRRPQSDPTGRKLQMSALCYGYRKPSNPPLATDEWLPAYEWKDPEGHTKRASRYHQRTPIGELATSDWPVIAALQAQHPGVPVEELWVRHCLPQSVLEKVCFVLGPMNRQDRQIESLLVGMAAEEARWQQILWDLYEHPEALDRLVPQSWACRPFGKEHQCPFVGVCHHGEPLSSGKFKPRVPHHQAELDAAVARGLLPAEGIQEDRE